MMLANLLHYRIISSVKNCWFCSSTKAIAYRPDYFCLIVETHSNRQIDKNIKLRMGA
jgi:hypothetical protein